MRLYPRIQNDKTQVRKKGQPVEERYCQHMKQPPFIPKMKVCQKQVCAAPKWEVSPWTRVHLKIKSIKLEFFLALIIYCFKYSVLLVVGKDIQRVR